MKKHSSIKSGIRRRTIYLTSLFRNALGIVVFFVLWLLVAGCDAKPTAIISTTTSAGPTPTVVHPTRTATPKPVKTATQTAQPTSSINLDASDLHGVSLRFWHVRAEPFTLSDTRLFDDLVAEFNRSNPWGVTVEHQEFPGYEDLIDEVQASLYGDLPEVITAYSYHLSRLDRSGNYLVDLAPYVNDPEWGYSIQEIEDFYPQAWERDQRPRQGGGTSRLGIPFMQWMQVLFYNASWAEELGFTSPPDTPQKLAFQLCTASEANLDNEDPADDGTGGWPVNTGPAAVAAWIVAFGGKIAPQQGEYDFDSDGTLAAFRYLKDLFDDGCAWINNELPSEQRLADQRALVISSSTGGIPFQDDAMRSAGSQDQWQVLAYPSEQGESVTLAYGPSLAMLQSNPEQQLAGWLFIQWLTSPENQARWIRQYGSLPTRASTLELLTDYQEANSQWADAAQLIPQAEIEPAVASWNTVRWTLSDAGEQLFSPRLEADEIPELVQMLNDTAAELVEQFQ